MTGCSQVGNDNEIFAFTSRVSIILTCAIRDLLTTDLCPVLPRMSILRRSRFLLLTATCSRCTKEECTKEQHL